MLGDYLFLPGHTRFSQARNVRFDVLCEVVGCGGGHHAAVFFGDEIAANVVGFVQISGVAGEQWPFPCEELGQTHLVENRPIALAGGTAALVIGVLKLVPFMAHNGFTQFVGGKVVGHLRASQTLEHWIVGGDVIFNVRPLPFQEGFG